MVRRSGKCAKRPVNDLGSGVPDHAVLAGVRPRPTAPAQPFDRRADAVDHRDASAACHVGSKSRHPATTQHDKASRRGRGRVGLNVLISWAAQALGTVFELQHRDVGGAQLAAQWRNRIG